MSSLLVLYSLLDKGQKPHLNSITIIGLLVGNRSVSCQLTLLSISLSLSLATPHFSLSLSRVLSLSLWTPFFIFCGLSELFLLEFAWVGDELFLLEFAW